jgi:uncharacterized small protein (DUF1192 family)
LLVNRSRKCGEYRAELVEEIAKIDAEIESRGRVKAAAEGLFG